MKVQLNKVCFGLPMKSFFIDYTVSKKRELPVVKEFVIRLVYSLTSTTLEVIQEYFGFSNKEMLAIINDLKEENLIEWEDGKVKLSYYAMSKFTEESGSLRPTFFEITDETSSVEFELYNFQMLYSGIKKSDSQSFNISLALPDHCYSDLLSKAQSAFDHNFNKFRENVLKEDVFSEMKELYKINHVSDRYDAILPLDIEYFIDASSPDKIKMEYVSSVVNEWDEEQKLFSLMDSTIEKRFNNDQYNAFYEYLNSSEDPLLLKYWDERIQSINLPALINRYKSELMQIENDTVMLVGNFYVEQNRKIILDRLKKALRNKSESSTLVWLGNSESKTWGRTADLGRLIEDICHLIGKENSTKKAILGVVCKSYAESKIFKNNFWKLSNIEFMGLPRKFGGENSEFLVIPGVMIASLFHLQLDDHRDISFPVGYISCDSKYVSAVSETLLKWTLNQRKFNDFFEDKDIADEEKIRNKSFIPTLQQSLYN